MKNLFALLIFAAAVGGWYLYDQHNKGQKQIADLSQSLPGYEQNVMTRRADFQTYVTLLELQQKVQAKRGEIAAIQEKERLLKDTLSRLSKERVDIINRDRQAQVGRIIPELTLLDGRKLAQVRILKVEDSGLSISLTSGVQKLMPSDLPADLRKTLHYP